MGSGSVLLMPFSCNTGVTESAPYGCLYMGKKMMELESWDTTGLYDLGKSKAKW